METPLIKIPRYPSPFPHQMKKKAKDGKFSKFMTILKKLLVNVMLVDDLEKILRYSKFMKKWLLRREHKANSQ